MKTNLSNHLPKCALAMLAAVFVTASAHAQIQAGTSAIIPVTQPIETGPILDVVPYVLSDGYTINLALIPSLTDFNGYDTAPTIPGVSSSLNNVVQLPTILPNFTVRQVVTTVNVWLSQTFTVVTTCRTVKFGRIVGNCTTLFRLPETPGIVGVVS